MENDKIREPQQKRSIEKKNRIIEVGFQLMCDKGYLKTTTQDIAKAAGVSTGIIYSYFNNKHDIFLLGLEQCVHMMFLPILNNLVDSDIKNLHQNIDSLISSLIEIHEVFYKAHNEIESLRYTDPEIASYMYNLEKEITQNVAQHFVKHGYPEKGLMEKVHICFNMIESFCHEVAFRSKNDFDYKTMRNVVVNTVTQLLEQ